MLVEVAGQTVIFAEVRDQDGPAESAQEIDAVEVVAVVDGDALLFALLQVSKGHLGDDQDVFTLVGRLFCELGERGFSMSTTTLVTGRKRPRRTRTGRL